MTSSGALLAWLGLTARREERASCQNRRPPRKSETIPLLPRIQGEGPKNAGEKSFETDAYLRNWLVRVTVNECRSLFRRPWRRVEDIEAYANQLQMPSEGHVRVFTAVMRLPERYRVPLVLHYYGGFSTGGVAYAVATSGFFQRVFGDHGLGERSEWGFTTSSGEAYGFTREFSDAASEGVVEDLEAAVEEVREFVLTPTA